MIPHPQKAQKGGEDAFLITGSPGTLPWLPETHAQKDKRGELKDNLVAVADGVGGWVDSGIDP